MFRKRVLKWGSDTAYGVPMRSFRWSRSNLEKMLILLSFLKFKDIIVQIIQNIFKFRYINWTYKSSFLSLCFVLKFVWVLELSLVTNIFSFHLFWAFIFQFQLIVYTNLQQMTHFSSPLIILFEKLRFPYIWTVNQKFGPLNRLLSNHLKTIKKVKVKQLQKNNYLI